MDLSVLSASWGTAYVSQMGKFNLINPFCGEAMGNLLPIIKITRFNSEILYRIARIDLSNAVFSTSSVRNLFVVFTGILFFSTYRIMKKCYCHRDNISFCDVLCFELAAYCQLC